MRNLYDQYEQPENRLTHALASTLYNDPKLLRKFVQWNSLNRPANLKKLHIIEQQIPGESIQDDNDKSKKGLPDAWIYDDESWSLLIESKIAAKLGKNQIVRHYNTAIRRGYTEVTVLVIDVEIPKYKLPNYVVSRTWTEIYEWLYKHLNSSIWVRQVVEYFEVAETKFVQKEYLKEGALTTFSGIPFNHADDYNYLNAKRLLRLIMEELRKRKDLVRALSMDSAASGRGMITGKGRQGVWDFLKIKEAKSDSSFTKYPHLTLSIQQSRLSIAVTIPHGVKPEFRRNLVKLGHDEFSNMMLKVTKNILSAIKKEKYAAPYVSILQRRYPSQSSEAIIDGKLEYDLRTAFDIDRNKKLRVKQQPQWIDATYNALSHKRSNLQLTVGAVFPYQYCKAHQSKVILDYIADTWIACKPLIDVMLKNKY